jgi:CheY-like chemotaxis protein
VILVVEDELLIRMPLAEYLRDCGYGVWEVGSVPEAKSVLDSAPLVDLVFTDVNLVGEEDGFMLTNWIREYHPTTKVLLTSGVADAAEKANKVCADGPLVAKPYTYSGVLQRINALLPQSSTHASPNPSQ